MRSLAALSLALLSLGAHAQSISLSAPAPAAPTSYMIAPGVSVTPLYSGASVQASTYDSNAVPVAYSEHTYAPAAYTPATYTAPLVSYTAASVATGSPAYAITPNAMGSGYVPQTPYDNTPYRFDMQQNGKRMSAADFDAWMQSKGIRIAGRAR